MSTTVGRHFRHVRTRGKEVVEQPIDLIALQAFITVVGAIVRAAHLLDGEELLERGRHVHHEDHSRPA